MLNVPGGKDARKKCQSSAEPRLKHLTTPMTITESSGRGGYVSRLQNLHNSHFRGMSWYVTSSGSVLRMVIGRIPLLSSSMAMSMGFGSFLEGSMRSGAPMAIWRALAPTTRALSNLVSLGGPTQIFLSELVSL